MLEEEKEKIKNSFPTECHFKVISINLAGVQEELNEVLADQGLGENRFKPGTRSRQGKYMSYDLSLRMESYDQMKQLEGALQRIEGVKFVL